MKIEVPKDKCGKLLTSEPVIVITTVDNEGNVNGTNNQRPIDEKSL